MKITLKVTNIIFWYFKKSNFSKIVKYAVNNIGMFNNIN